MQEETSNNNGNEHTAVPDDALVHKGEENVNMALPIINPPALNEESNSSNNGETTSNTGDNKQAKHRKMKQVKLTDFVGNAPVVPIIPNQENQPAHDPQSTTQETINTKDNSNKISLAKKNIVKILGLEYDSNQRLIIAMQLKKPNRVCYFPFAEVKKRTPLVLCEYLESHIDFGV